MKKSAAVTVTPTRRKGRSLNRGEAANKSQPAPTADQDVSQLGTKTSDANGPQANVDTCVSNEQNTSSHSKTRNSSTPASSAQLPSRKRKQRSSDTVTSPDGKKSTPSSKVSSGDGKKSTPSSIASSGDGKKSTPSSIASSGDGKKSTPSSIASSGDGKKSTPSSIASSGDGKKSTPSSIASSGDGKKSTSSSIASSGDGKKSTSANIASSGDGKKSTPSNIASSGDGKKSTSTNIASSGDGKKVTPSNTGSSEDSKKSTPSNTGSSVEKADTLSSEKGQLTKLTRRLRAQSSPTSKKGKSLRMLNISQKSKSGTQSSFLARRSLRAKSVRALTNELNSPFTSEIKRLSTSDGFWSSKPGSRSSSPLSESLSDASTQKQVGVLKKGGRSSTPDLPSSSSSSAKQKSVNTTVKAQSEKGEATLQKSSNSVAELRRLRTTEGFWKTSAPTLPSQTASRDCSPASSISQERGVRQSSRSLGKNGENKSVVQAGSSNQTPSNDDATLPKAKIKSKKALSTGTTKPKEDEKQITNTSSTNPPQQHTEQDTPVSILTKKRSNLTGKSPTKSTQPKQFPTSLKREKALSLVQRSSRFRKTRSVPMSPDHASQDSNTSKQLLSPEVTTQPGKRARLVKPTSDEIMVGGTSAPLKMKGMGLKKKKVPDLDSGTPESKSEDSKEDLNSFVSSGTTTSSGDANESQDNGVGTKSFSAAEFVLSDLVGSPELKRLNTTAGFWAASPDIGAVLGTNQSRRHRDVDLIPTEGSSKSKQAENGSIASLKSQRRRKLHILQTKDKIDQQLVHEQPPTDEHLPAQDTLTLHETATQEKQKPTLNFVDKKNKSKKQAKLPSADHDTILADVVTANELSQSENSEMDTSVADTCHSSVPSVRKSWKRGRRKKVPGEMRTNPVVSSVKTRGRRGLDSVAEKSLEIMQNLEPESEHGPEDAKDKTKKKSKKLGSGLKKVLGSGTKSSEATELSKSVNDLENDDFQGSDSCHKDDEEKRDSACRESSGHKRDNLFESFGDLYVPPEASGLDKVTSNEVTNTFPLPVSENLASLESKSAKLDLVVKEDKKDQAMPDVNCEDLMVKSRIDNPAGKSESEEMMVSKIIDTIVDQASIDGDDDMVEVENSSKIIGNEVEVTNVESVDAEVKDEAPDGGLHVKLKDVDVKKTSLLTDDIPQENSEEVDQCLTSVIISSLTSGSRDFHAQSENIVVGSSEKNVASRFDKSFPSNTSVNEDAVVKTLKLSGTAGDDVIPGTGVSWENKSAMFKLSGTAGDDVMPGTGVSLENKNETFKLSGTAGNDVMPGTGVSLENKNEILKLSGTAGDDVMPGNGVSLENKNETFKLSGTAGDDVMPGTGISLENKSEILKLSGTAGDDVMPGTGISLENKSEILKLSGTAGDDVMPGTGVSLKNKSAEEGNGSSTDETVEVCGESRPSEEMCEGDPCSLIEDNVDSSSKGIEPSVQVDGHSETLAPLAVKDINKRHEEISEVHTDSISRYSSNAEGPINTKRDSDLRMPFQQPQKSTELTSTTSVEHCQEKTQTEVLDSKNEHRLKVSGIDRKEISENVSDSVLSDTLIVLNNVSENIIESCPAETINLITHSDDIPAVETNYGEGSVKPRRKRKKQTTKFFRQKIHKVLNDFSVSLNSSSVSAVGSGVFQDDRSDIAASEFCEELLQGAGVGLDKQPLKRVRKRKRNSWQRGVLKKAAKWSKKVSKHGEPATSLVSERQCSLPSVVSEVGAATKSSVTPEDKAKSSTTGEDYSPAVKKSLKNMLKKLETNANLANAVLDSSSSKGRFLRTPQFNTQKTGSIVRKKPPAASGQEETTVNFVELTIEIPAEESAVMKKKRGRPRKRNDESSLPKLTPLHMLPSLRSVNPRNKTPPNLSPQVAAVSGTTLFFDLMEPKAAVAATDGDFVCESVDDTDLHLYLSGVSDEEQSPQKESTPSPAVNFTTEMSSLRLEESFNKFLLGTPADASEPFMDKRSSVISEKEPKKAGRPKMKGRRGRPPGIPMTDEERRQKEVLAQVSSSDDLLELQNIPGDLLSLDACGSPILADPSGLLSGKFSLRKKSTRSPLEMLELKRKREEERYDLEQEKRQARLIHLREKRCARESGDGFSDDGDAGLAAESIMQCSVVLSDFVKKLQLDSLETCSSEEINSQDAESDDGDVYSPGYDDDNDDSDDEDWCADLEEQRDEEWSDSRPHIPRLKLKRILKKGPLSQVKKSRARPQPAKEVSQEKQKHQPIKLVIKTEPMSDSSDHIGPKSNLLLDTPRVDKSGFESSYVDFLKGKTTLPLPEKVSRRKSYSSRFAESETKSANITPGDDTDVEILSLPAVGVGSSTSVLSSDSFTIIYSGTSVTDILSSSAAASNLPSSKNSVDKNLEASERSKRFSSIDEEDDDILILDLEDGTVDENLLKESIPAVSLPSSTITQTSSSATSPKIFPNERLQINKDKDAFDNKAIDDKVAIDNGTINDKGKIDNGTLNDKGAIDNGTLNDKGEIDNGTVSRTERSLSNDEMGLMLSSYNLTGSEALEGLSDGPVGQAAAEVSLEKALPDKKANEEPARGSSIEFGSSLGEKPVPKAAMSKVQHPQAQVVVSGAELAMASSEAEKVAENNGASEILDETEKAVSGGKETLNKVCGGSDLLNEVCGGSEISDKEVCGGSDLLNEVCGGSKISDKEVSGGSEIVNNEVSSGTRSLIKVCGGSGVLNKEISGGLQILKEEVCGGLEVLNKAVSSGLEILNADLCGSSEVSSELQRDTDILAQSRQQAERVLAQKSENTVSGDVTLDDSETPREEPVVKRSSDFGVPAESEEHVTDRASHDNNNVTSVFKSPSSISTKRLAVLTNNSNSPKKLLPQDSEPEDWRVKVILHSDKSPSGKYSCKRCGFTTLAKLTIESHIYSHIPGVLFRCAYCESEFSSMAAASSHLKNTHSLNEAKLHISCHIDEKNFYDREAAVFSEENGQQSPVLPNSAIADAGGQSPPLIISLVVSGNVGGGRGGRSSALARRFVCTHCGFSTNVKEDAEHHVLDLHPSQTLFACILCSESNFYTEREIKDHCATVHPSRNHPYRKLPDFYDAEQLSLKGKAASQDDRENIFERMNSIFQDETQPGPGPVDHRQKAKEYLYLQEGWREKTTVEADSTTADDSTEGQSIPSSPEETCTKSVSTAENEAADHQPRAKMASDADDVAGVKASEGDADISSSARVMAETAAAAVRNTETLSAAIRSTTQSQEEICSSQENQQEDPPSFHSSLDTDCGAEALDSSQSQEDKELADCSGEGMGLKIVEVVSLCGQIAEEVEEGEREDTHEEGLRNQITDTGLSVSTCGNTQISTSPEKSTPLTEKQELPTSRKETTAVVQERKETANNETRNSSAPSVSTESPISSDPSTSNSASMSTPSLAGGLPLSYKCNACKVHTPYLLMMVKHLKAKHPNMHCFACPYCKSTHSFVSQKQLRQHVKQSHPDKFGRNEISLSEDAKKFVEAMVLPLGPECIRVGSRIVLEEDIHTCTYCQVKMTSLSNVYEHLRSKHSDLFEFVCPVCQSFKSKVLDEISDHCLNVHRSALDTDKVHVSVPKNLFIALTCISKNGKYIEKALSISIDGPSGSSSISELTEAVHGSSGRERKSSIPHVSQSGPSSSVSRTLNTTAHSHIQIQQVAQPVFAIPLVSAGIGTIPGVSAATRPVFAISSALFDTSTLASSPQVSVSPQVIPIIQSAGASSFLSPIPKPTQASSGHHSVLSKQQPPLGHTKPQEKAAGPAKSLPVLNVPTIKPRASTAQALKSVHASKSSSDSEPAQKGPQTSRIPASVPTQIQVSRPPVGQNPSIDSLPDDEPNPDAFKIFNLRPTAPLVGLSPPSSSPAASPGVPTVYPPVSAPLTSNYIQGPIAGFPPGMVIAPNLMPLTFPFSQHQPLVQGMLPQQQQQQQLLSKSSTSLRHPRMPSSTAPQPVSSLANPSARNSMINATVESAAVAAASLYLKKQREQQKELYLLKQRQLQAHRNELLSLKQQQAMPKAHQAHMQRPSLAGQVYHHPQGLSSPLTLDQHLQAQHGSTNMPRPAMFPSPPSSSSQSSSSSAMHMASSLARTNRGVHKRSSSLYQCPYCPVTLKALEVASHIQQHHPGNQVSFRKILDQDRH